MNTEKAKQFDNDYPSVVKLMNVINETRVKMKIKPIDFTYHRDRGIDNNVFSEMFGDIFK